MVEMIGRTDMNQTDTWGAEAERYELKIPTVPEVCARYQGGVAVHESRDFQDQTRKRCDQRAAEIVSDRDF